MPQLPDFLQSRRNQVITGLIIVLLVVLGVLLAQPRQPVAQNVPVEVELTWWKPFYGDDVYSEIVEEFKAIPGNEQVNIEIISKQYDDDYYKNLIADIARGAGPDIFSLRNDDLPAYKEFMAPITLFQGKKLTDYKNDFVPLVVRDTMDLDQVYAAASYVDNLQLYYNQNLLSQANIALPAKSWSELDRQLGALNRRDTTSLNFLRSAISLGTGADQRNGQGGNINRFQDILPMLLLQNGNLIYDYQTTSPVLGVERNVLDVTTGLVTEKNFDAQGDFQNDSTYKAIRFYADYADASTARYSWNDNSDNNIDAFVEGKLAYIIHYRYFEDIIKQRNPRLPYSVTDLPQLDENSKKTYGFFFMDGLNRKLQLDAEANKRDVAKNAKYRKAQEFIEFLTTKSAQTTFATKTGLPSARRDVIQQQLQGDQSLRVFAAGSLYASNYYKPDVERTEAMWGTLMYRYLYENQPLPESIEEMVNEYRNIVAAGPKLR